MDALAAAAIGAGQKAMGGLLSNITSIGNATNSTSTSHAENESHQAGASSAYSAGSQYGYGYSDSVGDSWSNNGSYANESATSTTYGREASAEARARADEANRKNYEMWKAQADYNATEAQKSRDYQERMANTAYQRAVKDLMAAGINPILAYNTMGSATPTGATATSGMQTSHMANTYAQSESRSRGSSQSWGSSGSHNESHSKNENWAQNHSSSSSWNEGYSSGVEDSNSYTRTQLMDALGSLGNMINGGTSGKKIKEKVKENISEFKQDIKDGVGRYNSHGAGHRF